MPKRVRPYGSAVDAERAAGRPVAIDLASTLTMGDIAGQAAAAIQALTELMSDAASPDMVRDVIGGLEHMGQSLPELYEQLARALVAQIEDGPDAPPFLVIEVVEALAAAGQAADMMTAALNQAVVASADVV
jgi:recombinational DNA repair protein (RecF pathway)